MDGPAAGKIVAVNDSSQYVIMPVIDHKSEFFADYPMAAPTFSQITYKIHGTQYTLDFTPIKVLYKVAK